MFGTLLTIIFITVLSYFVSEYILHIIKIYELGLQEYNKIKKSNLLNELKEEFSKDKITKEKITRDKLQDNDEDLLSEDEEISMRRLNS
jgi:hypothetical protein